MLVKLFARYLSARLGAFLAIVVVSSVSHAQNVQTIYVSPTGNDSNPGTQAQPKRTPFGAMEKVRLARMANSKDQFIVQFAAGRYHLSQKLLLNQQHSGDGPTKPTILRGIQNQVFFDGSVQVTGWQLASGGIANRIPAAARPNVFQTGLPQFNGSVLDPGEMTRRGYPHETTQTWSTLVFNNNPMTLARHPNTGWSRTPTNHNGSSNVFGMTDPVPYGWVNTGDIWAHGFFGWDWADAFERVGSFNSGSQTVSLATTPAYGIKPNMRYYLVNAIEALDGPGEYFIDKATNIVYFYVPLIGQTDAQKIASLNAGTYITALDDFLVETYDSSDMQFERITFQNGRRGAVYVRWGARVEFKGCTFRRFNTLAALVGSGTDHLFLSCDFYDLDEDGLRIVAGDRPTLTPAGHEIRNCWFRDFAKVCMSYRAGVDLWGVGHRVSNCRIEDAPHSGLVFHGNDHTLEFTEFERLCLETNDSAAVYHPRDFTMQGTRIYYNSFKDIRSYQTGTHSNFAVGVFLDDMASGVDVSMNIFKDVQIGTIIGGGRDNKLTNNFYFDSETSIQADARGTSWASDFWTAWNVPAMLAAVPYQSMLWRSRYPELAKLVNDDPQLPRRNDITRCVSVGATNWMVLQDGMETVTNKRRPYNYYAYFNSATLTNPGFTDIENGNYTFGAMSPLAWMKVKPIYPDQIGMFTDAYRTWLP